MKSEHTLKAGAIGTAGAACLGVIMMAPALGIYANLGLMGAGAGKATAAVFLAALLLTLPTAVSYALVAREIPSAGSAYTWLSEAINPLVGSWVGFLLVSTYFIAVLLQPLLFGLFFNDLLAALFGIQTGYGTWMAGVLLSTLLVALLAYPGIEISARSSVILTILEAVVILALACTILFVSFRSGDVRFTSFNPASSLNGAHGFFKGLVFALLSFVGFGVITTAAEETHSPRSVIPRVMVASCILLGLFWAVSAWCFSLALPAEAWGQEVARGVNPVAVIARRYWHSGYIVVVITALTAVLGVYLSSIVGYARVAYAMGRDGTLPSFLGRLHPKHRVPWNAQHVVLCATVLVAALWGRWLGLYLSYDWWGTTLVFFAMVSNILVNVGCLTFFGRFRRREFSILWHGVVPVLGILTSFVPIWYCFGSDLWNAGWKSGQSIIVCCGAIVLLSWAYTIGLAILRPGVLGKASETPGGN